MVDIIIPAYNCSKTLPRLLASIGAQTKPEKCIVTIVDDCSTEDLKPIIKDFKKYFNIKLQYIKLEENLKWPGLVRQVGLNRTNAPYVMFLDSDDFLSPRAVELANREMRSTNADVIIGHFYGEDSHNQWNLYNEDCTTWLHGNIYKREFLKEKDIFFEPLYNEDGSFNTECFLLADIISYLPEPIYFWTRNLQSITKSEFFKINNYSYFIQSLQKSYLKLFKKTQKEQMFLNIGEHISIMYNFYNLSLKKDKEIALSIARALCDFSKFLQDNIFSRIKKDFIKRGFCRGFYTRLEGQEGDNISVLDFWEKFGFKETLGELILNESNNN
jgi:glycosyltransferase involved in cell wall biosynthesis